MCELFAMSSRHPATVNFSLKTFGSHGGETGPHGDGWGIAFFDGRDVRLLREPEPLAHSDWMTFMAGQKLRRTNVISHIRKATIGEVALRNTQPFAREMGGRFHVFAHNGDLPGIFESAAFSSTRFAAVGDTDSERAFCSLLDRLQSLWPPGPTPPCEGARMDVLAAFAAEIAALGPANFIYSDGDLLFAHGNERTQQDGGIRPPGLYMLCRECREPCIKKLPGGVTVESEDDQRVMLIASTPLSAEGWKPFPAGEVLAFRAGDLIN